MHDCSNYQSIYNCDCQEWRHLQEWTQGGLLNLLDKHLCHLLAQLHTAWSLWSGHCCIHSHCCQINIIIIYTIISHKYGIHIMDSNQVKLYPHWKLEITPTSTSFSVLGCDPPDEVVPHPVTVAVAPAKSTPESSVGIQTGLIRGWAAQSTSVDSFIMEKS